MPNEHHQGPFVENDRGDGLLKRLLRGGGNDPTAPHGHLEPSTSQRDPIPEGTSPQIRKAMVRERARRERLLQMPPREIDSASDTAFGTVFRTMGVRGVLVVAALLGSVVVHAMNDVA